ncbi:hypothetical protein [Prosthecobacter dejongeii]|uniref:Uncharacterized protein n=1 Tax=Prosthecobacter dejongeii TaxID=48465 RepID=A0A7W7YJ62_9BACT|nr:hypothetical protein [Prosthecobacter dejongeii]MBB5037124.1 hypothetical protein [Prosthecobacter dejongeii]
MIATRQGQPTNAADRALIITHIQGLVKSGTPLRKACAEVGINHNNYYRWTADANPIQEPKETAKRGRKAKWELGEADARRLRFWHLVKKSVPLAVEAFIAEGLTGNEEPYFKALKACIASPTDTGHRASPELARAMQAHWQAANKARKVVTWPLSVQRACRATAQEAAQFRGDKHATDARGTERRGVMIRTPEGDLVPWYPGAIWESDDMSVNDPFRFHDAATQEEMLGRQILATIDAFALNWLGESHIGRERDSYRAEDIASHFRAIVEEHGLPYIWRIEKGRWDNDFIWGVKLGTDAEGKDIRWGGLDKIIHIREKHTSDGKANVEGAFDLLQALMDHGFSGQTLSIGRERGEFEAATRLMLRANRENPDLDALSKFWTIEQSADAVAQAMALFNQRPKRRQCFANETRVPAELWKAHVKRPCPSDSMWRFHAIKTTATVRKGIIEVKAPHYPVSFRFRVHGGSRTPNVHCDNGHEVLVAFTPGSAWEGCEVFNRDKSARNREGWGFGERIGVAEYMPDGLQEDLYGASYSPGQKRAAAQVRRATRLIIGGTNFQGRRISHAQDSFGNQLTQEMTSDRAETATTHPIMSTPPERETPTPVEMPSADRTAEAPRKSRTSKPRLHLTTPRRGQATETTAPDFDEEEELRALQAL